MGFYKIADRIFEIKNKYDYTEKLCRDYKTAETDPDYVIEVSDDEIEKENDCGAQGFSPAYLESLAVYRKIAELLFKEDCFLMHAAVIEYEGKAYAFTAKSGTGKTTHISLWEKAFGDKVRIINGDKPLVRMNKKENGTTFTVYGTPWSGKEHKNINTSAPLGGFCLLYRSDENRVEKADDSAIPFLLGQIFYKKDAQYLGKMLSFLDELVTSVPIYNLGVNMNLSAAFTARDSLCK